MGPTETEEGDALPEGRMGPQGAVPGVGMSETGLPVSRRSAARVGQARGRWRRTPDPEHRKSHGNVRCCPETGGHGTWSREDSFLVLPAPKWVIAVATLGPCYRRRSSCPLVS